MRKGVSDILASSTFSLNTVTNLNLGATTQQTRQNRHAMPDISAELVNVVQLRHSGSQYTAVVSLM